MSEIIEGKPQLSPGVCFICELSNPVKYWDTYRDFYGIVRESLDGRKYVCEECIAQGAKLFGWHTPDQAAAVQNLVSELTRENDELKKELQSFKDLRETLDFLTKSDAPKPKPTRKPAAAKA